MIHLQFLTNARPVWGGGCALGILILCAGCQPSLDERLVTAKQHMDGGDYRASIIELKNILREAPENAEARSLIARSSYQLADFPTAVGEYERSLQLGGDSTADWIGLGEALLRGGEAVEAFDRVVPNLDLAATNDRELALAANIYAALGNYDQAATLFQKSLDQDGDSEQGLIGLAMIAASKGDSKLADELLEKATDSAHATSRAFLMQGYNKLMRRDLTGAIAAFELAIQREGIHTNLADRFDARAALATTLIDLNDLHRVQATLDDLVRYFPGHPIHHYLRGRVAFAKGNLDVASLELQEYLSKAPDDLSANVVIGAVSFYQSNYRQAEMYLRQAVRENVGGQTAIRLLAETRLRLNKPEEALKLLRGAGVDDSDAFVLGLLGRAEFRSGNRAAGLAYFEQGVRANPDSTEIRLMYSMALLADGQNKKAVEMLDSMRDYVDPSHRKEMLKLFALERQGERQKAEISAVAFLALHEDDSTAHALVGSFMQSIGNSDQAFRHFQDSLRIDTTNNMALLGLATLARDGGNIAEAEQMLRRLLGNEPSNMPALAMFADLLLTDARYEELATTIESAVAAAPTRPGPRLLQARVALASGQPSAAIAMVRAARKQFTDVPAFLHLEGIILISIGQTESALVSLTRAAVAEPDNGQFQFDLSVAYLDVRNFFGASNAITLYRQINPEDPVGLSVQVSALIGQRKYPAAHGVIDAFEFDVENGAIGNVLRGDINLAEGRATDAISQFEIAAKTIWDQGIALRLSSAYLAAGSDKAPQPLIRWLADNPGDATVRRSYAEILQFSGSNADAVKEYEAVVAANANDAIALNNLAWEYSLSGRLEALDLAKRAYELEPEQASIIDTYAWILFLNDDARTALKLLRKAAKLAPGNGNINYHLAKVLAELGEREEAVGMIEKLLMSNNEFTSRADALRLAESLQ